VKISVTDPRPHNEEVAEEVAQAIKRVLRSGVYLRGSETQLFEREFADFCGVRNCVSVANGTDALEIALRALDINQGEVACVANAGFYSSTSILAVGALPLYVDVDWESMTMNPVDLDRKITKRTRAIIVTHLYGQMADMPKIMSIAREHQIPVIEDCAQAHGAKLNQQCAGNWGDLGCFSFYPTKNLGAYGDAGAITTANPDLAKKARRLREYGWGEKYTIELSGGRNSRIDELQAAILRVKLRQLDRWNRSRKEIARTYSEHLDRLTLTLPSNLGDSYVSHLYVVRTKLRDQLRKGLESLGISTAVHYPVPDYRQLPVRNLPKQEVLEKTEQCCARVVSLPCFPGMTELQVEKVINAITSEVGL
jgi:dTDP-3-amino-2,3,6-trideoxy-4-keto-D-glucose/dTDP-3-amino-3,4,6-trideoxy-alpha-D-glucose/dTDP-2,6-dideoxy-D-kanosamine transaminase